MRRVPCSSTFVNHDMIGTPYDRLSHFLSSWALSYFKLWHFLFWFQKHNFWKDPLNPMCSSSWDLKNYFFLDSWSNFGKRLSRIGQRPIIYALIFFLGSVFAVYVIALCFPLVVQKISIGIHLIRKDTLALFMWVSHWDRHCRAHWVAHWVAH